MSEVTESGVELEALRPQTLGTLGERSGVWHPILAAKRPEISLGGL